MKLLLIPVLVLGMTAHAGAWPLDTEPAADAHVLFLCRFNRSAIADVAGGEPHPTGLAVLTRDNGGRFGEALALTPGRAYEPGKGVFAQSASNHPPYRGPESPAPRS